MLTTQENLALHLCLLFALAPEQAAKVAQCAPQPLADAANRLGPKLRGRTIDFNRYLTAQQTPGVDAFCLDKEVQLAQLQHQHDECLRCWTITADHAAKMAEHAKANPSTEAAPPKKPYVGDIRFLQLAKHLRKEMDKIEKAIADHIKELQEKPAERKVLRPDSTKPVESKSPLSVVTTSPTAAPSAPSTLPAVAAARVATVQSTPSVSLPANESIKELLNERKPIPIIPTPPPRRVNKYSNVNR